MSIYNRFKLIRQTLKINQVNFARELNTEQSRISDIERGRIKPNFEIIEKLYIQRHVNLNWLICGKEQMFVNDTRTNKSVMEEPEAIYGDNKVKLYEELYKAKDEIIQEKERLIKEKEAIIKLLEKST